MAEQLTFDWPVGVALGPEDFFVSDANADAFAILRASDTWAEGKLVLTGPEGAGKSHLARVFMADTGAVLWDGIDTHPGGPVVVEDADRLPHAQEEALFHLHNNLRGQHPLLLTARAAPARWDIALPDLKSRMQATQIARIDDPDDALLQVLLMKLFADRQINPPVTLVQYLAPRIERSFTAAQAIVAALDAEALRLKKPIGRGMAAALLDKDAPSAR